jgi:hypothetical protein
MDWIKTPFLERERGFFANRYLSFVSSAFNHFEVLSDVSDRRI